MTSQQDHQDTSFDFVLYIYNASYIELVTAQKDDKLLLGLSFFLIPKLDLDGGLFD